MQCVHLQCNMSVAYTWRCGVDVADAVFLRVIFIGIHPIDDVLLLLKASLLVWDIFRSDKFQENNVSPLRLEFCSEFIAGMLFSGILHGWQSVVQLSIEGEHDILSSSGAC